MSSAQVINFSANTDEITGKARIIAKHLNAMADELEQFGSGDVPEPAREVQEIG